MRRLTALATTLALLLLPGLAHAAEPKSPEETYKGYPNRLADLPPGWATSKPLRLQVCFNLKYPPNSPEAEAFLKTMVRTIEGLPYGVKVGVERPITPAKYAYCNSLSFKDWATNRAYETSEAFLKYYREQWKPVVTEASEQLAVIDDVAIAR
ncbi:MAG: hypothetical protein MUF07_17510 [Steroidobacteraceae bacterium]|nr:hypothetical protein [Steroidobacteraceae bacterium]